MYALVEIDSLGSSVLAYGVPSNLRFLRRAVEDHWPSLRYAVVRLP